MALKRINPPQKLSTVPPPPGAMRVAKPVQVVLALQGPARRDPGSLYSPKVSAEMAEWMKKGTW